MAASHNRFLDKGTEITRQGGQNSLDQQESIEAGLLSTGTAEEVQELIYRKFNPRFACRMRARLTKL